METAALAGGALAGLYYFSRPVTIDQVAAHRFDYVVVGGGSAGCVLAARLSEDPLVSVLLLEAGPSDSASLKVHIPSLWTELQSDETLKHLDWGYWTDEQQNTRDERWPGGSRWLYPRGKMLGGCSSNNAMVYIRGNRADYDRWADLTGDSAWSYDEVLPFFVRSEDNGTHGVGPYHGVGGPLHVQDAPAYNVVMHDFVAAGEKAGLARNPDFNGPAQEGIGFYQQTVRKGWRCSTSQSFLQAARARRNLYVLTEAHALKINFVGQRASGVRIQHKGKSEHDIYATREVLVCAGAINTPHLLMLSGVGPAETLRYHGIPVKSDLPGVGENLQDHPNVFQQFHTTTDETLDEKNVNKVACLARWALTGGGQASTNGLEAGAFLKTKPYLAQPDVQLHVCPGLFPPAMAELYGFPHQDELLPEFLRNKEWHAKNFGGQSSGFIVTHTLLHTSDRGRVTLRSNNPLDAPVVNPRYFSNDADLDSVVESMRIVRNVVKEMGLVKEEVSPGADVERPEDIRAYARLACYTCYHPVGTAKMGRDDDPAAVVDSRLRVRGTKGLRIVDASVMPEIVSGNTNAPTIMIAEKAAEFVRADRLAARL